MYLVCILRSKLLDQKFIFCCISVSLLFSKVLTVRFYCSSCNLKSILNNKVNATKMLYFEVILKSEMMYFGITLKSSLLHLNLKLSSVSFLLVY